MRRPQKLPGARWRAEGVSELVAAVWTRPAAPAETAFPSPVAPVGAPCSSTCSTVPERSCRAGLVPAGVDLK